MVILADVILREFRRDGLWSKRQEKTLCFVVLLRDGGGLFSLSTGGCKVAHFYFSFFSLPDEIHCYQDEIDAELQNARPKLRGVYAAYAKEGTEC